MSWLEKLAGQVEAPTTADQDSHLAEAGMTPGLTGEYDWELREKAGMHQPPPPPEYMGLEGEYDPEGLLKRVALAFDQDAQIDELETLQIQQSGGTIILQGSVPTQEILSHITKVICKVDGTKAIDSKQVAVTE